MYSVPQSLLSRDPEVQRSGRVYFPKPIDVGAGLVTCSGQQDVGRSDSVLVQARALWSYEPREKNMSHVIQGECEGTQNRTETRNAGF